MNSTVMLRLLLAVFALGLGACGAKSTDHDHSSHAHGHSHEAKHGGVAVTLGNEELHIEFTHGASPGIISAYFLDAHMENYVRIATPSFSGSVIMDGQPQPVVFTAVASAATGETAGDSSLFEARIDGLTDRRALLVAVPTVTVKGRTYTGINASVPAK